jgi:hypothetical protein
VALVLAGCSSGSASSVEDTGEPAVGATVRVDPVNGFALPLDAYQPDAPGRSLIDRAHAEAFRACMQRFGFALQPPDLSGSGRGLNNRQRYGIWDENQAGRLGYHAPRQTPPQQDPLLDTPAAQAVATGAGQQVDGLPDGGCQGEANQTIDAGTQGGGGQSQLVDRLAWDAYERAANDSRVRRAVSAWSACMAKAGYRYPDPMRANNDPAFQNASPSPTEIRTAVTDVRCKRSTNLVNTRATVETAYQRRAVERNAEALREVKASRDRTLQNAAAVLAAAG